MAHQRIVVGAHYGLRDWLGQRVTAVLMALYTFLFLAVLLWKKPVGQLGWLEVFQPQWMKLASLTFLACLLYHAWVGVRDIWMDYVKPTGLRLLLQVGTIVWLAACGVWALRIFLR
jgi:succinate dehydrogenase / fumarate reductase membrane anchor subunit